MKSNELSLKRSMISVVLLIFVTLPLFTSCQNNSATGTASSAESINSENPYSETTSEEPGLIKNAVGEADGVNMLEIASITNGRKICAVCSMSETSAAFIRELDGLYSVEFIDIAKGSRICSSFSLNEFEKQNYTVVRLNKAYYNKDTLYLNLLVKKNGEDKIYCAYYEIKPVSGKNASGKFYVNDFIDYSEKNSEGVNLRSESGRYITNYKNGDLYLYDNTNGKNILVYDAKPDKETESTQKSEYRGAKALFFAGDVIYYNICGWESSEGVESYDPASKKTVKLNKDIYPYFCINDQIYGSDEYNSNCFGRYSVSQPDKIEKLIGYDSELYPLRILLSYDKKSIALITEENPDKKTTTVAVYDTASFREIKRYELKNIVSSIYSGAFAGDYIYLPIKNNEKEAYVIKIR